MPDYSIKVRFSDLGWPVVSPLISWWSGHWANHVETIVGNTVYGSLPPYGVTMGYATVSREETIEVFCTRDQFLAINGFFNAQLGKPYDYLSVLGFAFRPPFDDPQRWFCSELAAAALQHAGLLNIYPKPQRVSPGLLYEELTK